MVSTARRRAIERAHLQGIDLDICISMREALDHRSNHILRSGDKGISM